MSGASEFISIDVDDKQMQQVFGRLQQAGQNMDPVFADIGEYLLESTKQRFVDQVDPDGLPWQPLSDNSHKEKNADKSLLEHGGLLDSLHYNSDAQQVEFGTNLIYGATHQFGDDARNIPARAFLGISVEDELIILDLAEAFLLEHLAPV